MKAKVLIVEIVHLLIWILIFASFFNRKLARINLFYIIPVVYISHILPFHTLCKLKDILSEEESDKNNVVDGETVKQEEKKLMDRIHDIRVNLGEGAYIPPFTAQGMVLLAGILSVYTLDVCDKN